MKTCTRCGETKPFSSYYKMKAGLHGLEARCKDCVRVLKRAHAHAHPEKAREQSRAKYAKNAENRRAQARAYRAANKDKCAARWKVKEALRSGKLTRPAVCSDCGQPGARVEAHHRDYSKPLDVKWLCSLCHAALRSAGEVMPT